MELLSFVSIGILTGWVVSWIFRDRRMPATTDVTIGIVGSLVGGFWFGALRITENMIWETVAASVLGAVLFLLVAHLAVRMRRPRPT